MSSGTTSLDQFRSEKDALVFLGLLSHIYLEWDPPIPVNKTPPEVTHFAGLNIHAAIVDSPDGEVLAMDANRIHEYNSPVEHAEQLAVRRAIERVKVKRPRSAATTVEDYYRNQLFYASGSDAEAYAHTGATLYTTLEPCPMCAATLCVCRMKRVVYIVQDGKYGGSWDGRYTNGKGIKDTYYASYDLQYEQFTLPAGASPLIDAVRRLNEDILKRISGLSSENIPDTQFFDYLHPELAQVAGFLEKVTYDDLATDGAERRINSSTLQQLKALCRFPIG